MERPFSGKKGTEKKKERYGVLFLCNIFEKSWRKGLDKRKKRAIMQANQEKTVSFCKQNPALNRRRVIEIFVPNQFSSSFSSGSGSGRLGFLNLIASAAKSL